MRTPTNRPPRSRRAHSKLVALTVLAVAALVAWNAPAGEVASAAPASRASSPEFLPSGARKITFPVRGNVTYSNTFGAPRSGGRTHQGIDLMGAKMQHLLAAADGTVTLLRHTDVGTAGNWLIITDDHGWQYWYMHLNNDTPGTDDGANRFEQAFVPGLRVGSRVRAGQHIGYLGDSGNAEDTSPHLHFEMRDPGGRVINPYNSLIAK